MRKNCHCLSDYVDILKLNLVERRLQNHPTRQPCQMGWPHLGTSHHPWLPRTFRWTKSSWWPHDELGLQDEMLGIRMGHLKTCVVFRWESFSNCGNNASWENFAISLSKSMPYPEDKPAICNMSIGSEIWNISHSIISLHFTSFYFISCCYFVNVKYILILINYWKCYVNVIHITEYLIKCYLSEFWIYMYVIIKLIKTSCYWLTHWCVHCHLRAPLFEWSHTCWLQGLEHSSNYL